MGNDTPEFLTFYKDNQPLLAIIEDEFEICIFKEGEERIYSLLKDHKDWDSWSD